MSINNKLSPIAFFVFLLLFFVPPQLVAANNSPSFRIATVDVRYLLKNAPQSDVASKALKERFQDSEKALDKEMAAIKDLEELLKRAVATLSKDERRKQEREIRSRKRTQSRALEDYREDLRLARNTALEDVQKLVFEAIDTVRKEEKIDVVIQDYVSASERISITEIVLDYLQDKLQNEQKKGGKNDNAS